MPSSVIVIQDEACFSHVFGATLCAFPQMVRKPAGDGQALDVSDPTEPQGHNGSNVALKFGDLVEGATYILISSPWRPQYCKLKEQVQNHFNLFFIASN